MASPTGTSPPRGRLTGLTAAQVEESRRLHGENVLTPPERDPWWKLFLEKFDDPVIRILMIAAVIAIVVGAAHGEFIEGLGIIIAILLATTLAFLNEYKANREFDILNQVNDEVPIKVIRDGAYTTVPRRGLVVGDVVLVEIGEETPADGDLIEAVSLHVDESRLTGESLPVVKHAQGAAADEPERDLAYPHHKLLRGSTIADGHGVMIVSAVGDRTEIGDTARAAAEETDEETPLNRQLEGLSKVIGVVGFCVAALTYAALVVRGVVIGEMSLTTSEWLFSALLLAAAMAAGVKVWLPIVYDACEMCGLGCEPPGWLEIEGFTPWLASLGVGAALFGAGLGVGVLTGLFSTVPAEWLPGAVAGKFLTYFMIAVTIIVVAVPEGLAMSVTLSLAYSMRKMTATNNLVRRMHACETIGAATVICSDKTGTLTMNEMRVFEMVAPAVPPAALEARPPALPARLLAEAISANSTANLSRKPGEKTTGLGNPTECALLLWLEEKGVDYVLARDAFAIEYQWVFSTERKFMGTLGKSAATGGRLLHVKGAPEIVLARCDKALTERGPAPLAEHAGEIASRLRDYQARGMRTLGLAYSESVGEGADVEHLAQGLTWLGFVAISDPVRAEVPPAIKACRVAGIDVKIITGDNSETAQEIGRQIGLLDKHTTDGQHLGGAEFGKLETEAAGAAVEELRVLSRARPLDKLKLVKLLQDQGHVVAVTGDGTNDAPALNHANVGLSMGKTGTSVAKEASDIVLLDDSFRSIVNAVHWGRSLYQNIQRFILFQLTINVAALGIAFLGPWLGVELPLTVIQMLWVNLIMDTFAALALATEPPHDDVMLRPPRKSGDFIVTPRMAAGIFGTAAVFLVALVTMLLWFEFNADQGASGDPFTPWEKSVFFTTFVLLQFWNLFNARRLGGNESALAGLSENRAFLVIALAILLGQFVITTFGGNVFRTTPLGWREWLVILSATSLVLWAGEALRLFSRLSNREKVQTA